MDVLDIIKDLISSVGFPIVAYLLMYFENKKLVEALNKIGDKMETTDKRLDNIEDALKIKREG